MNIGEIKKELCFLYEAKKILEKYYINTKSIDKRISNCLQNIELIRWCNNDK